MSTHNEASNMIRLITTVNLPIYAIDYLTTGDPDGYDKQDIEDIDLWVNRFKRKHNSITFDYSWPGEFSTDTAFGMPCDTVSTKVFGELK